MARPTKLSDAEVAKQLADLDNWEMDEGRSAISKSFVFKNFVRSFTV